VESSFKKRLELLASFYTYDYKNLVAESKSTFIINTTINYHYR